MFNPSRDQARRFFIEAWHKHLQNQLMTPLELMVVDILSEHPEYHELLGQPESDVAELLQREWTGADGVGNPFMHLSLHLAIAEQLSIDQPPGIRQIFERLQNRHGHAHDALHEILECLGETIWQAQQSQQPLDSERYLDCLRRRL